jgi:hypothetical protein
MRHRILLIAAELDLRARLARELHSSGYAVELACDMKRAMTLAAVNHFRVAIVAPGPSPPAWQCVTRHRAENDRGRGGIGRDRSLASLASRNRIAWVTPLMSSNEGRKSTRRRPLQNNIYLGQTPTMF